MNAVFDPKALSSLSNILSRVLDRKGDPSGQLDWVKKEIPFEPVVYEFNSKHYTYGHPNVKRAREAVHELELSVGLVGRLQAYLRAQYRLAREKADALAIRTGFASLPLSILSDIIELAALPSYRGPGSKLGKELKAHNEAIRLSHVSRLFRVLVLNELKGSFWSSISDHLMDMEKIKFCIARSRKSPLNIYIGCWELRQPDGHLERLLKTCFLHAKKWGSLTVGEFRRGAFDHGTSDNLQPGERETNVHRSMETISRVIRNGTLPKLKKLVVHFNKALSPDFLSHKYNPFWYWSMPNLVELTISGCHPPQARSFDAPSLKEFTIMSDALSSMPYKMMQLALFLAFCRSLEKVSLRFLYWETTTPCELRSIVSVREVDLRFFGCKPEASVAICNSIHFPKATKMSFAIGELYVEEIFSPPEPEVNPHSKAAQMERELKYQAIVAECLGHHSSLKSLTFSFVPNTRLITSILLPLTSLPLLEELSLKLQRWDELKFWGDTDDSKSPSSVPGNLHLPPIRRLTLYSTDISTNWDRIFPWSEKLLVQLKKQGELDAFDKLELCEIGRWPKAALKASELKGTIHNFLPPGKISTRWIYSDSLT